MSAEYHPKFPLQAVIDTWAFKKWPWKPKLRHSTAPRFKIPRQALKNKNWSLAVEVIEAVISRKYFAIHPKGAPSSSYGQLARGSLLRLTAMLFLLLVPVSLYLILFVVQTNHNL